MSDLVTIITLSNRTIVYFLLIKRAYPLSSSSSQFFSFAYMLKKGAKSRNPMYKIQIRANVSDLGTPGAHAQNRLDMPFNVTKYTERIIRKILAILPFGNISASMH